MDYGEGRGYRMWKGVDLQALNDLIRELEAKVRMETQAAAGGSFGYALGRLDTAE